MINELALLKLNPENASTKQKIASALSERWPLTAKQVFERLQREYGANISYQGVHKILKELESDKVIERKKDGYQLSIEWLQKSKKTLEDVEKRYLQHGKIKLPGNFQGAIEIEFDNYTDLCISTVELLLSRQLARNPKDLEFICTLEYGWWPFKFRFEHFELLCKMMLRNPKSKNIIRKITPFGTWARAQYNSIGAVSAPIGSKVDINEDIFVQGDCIIEVNFDDKTKQLFEIYYNKWKSIEDTFKEFGVKEEPKINAVMRITKNPEMAKFLRKQLEKVFETGNKK